MSQVSYVVGWRKIEWELFEGSARRHVFGIEKPMVGSRNLAIGMNSYNEIFHVSRRIFHVSHAPTAI